MIAEQIQDALISLQKYGTTGKRSDFEGGMWSGYTRFGFDIMHQAADDTYLWQEIFDNGLSESITDTKIFTLEELKEFLQTYNWQ
jgi:hypothetical protein